jgi:hypothetical protein
MVNLANVDAYMNCKRSMENMWQGLSDANYTPCIDVTEGYVQPEQQQIPPFEEVLNLVLDLLYLVY